MYDGKLARGCLVTPQESLVSEIQNRVGNKCFDVVTKLSEIAYGNSYDVCLIDAKVPDLSLWPLPRFKWNKEAPKNWMFLVSTCDEINSLNPLPEGSLIFQGSPNFGDDLISELSRIVDPDAGKKIERVKFLDELRMFIVRLFNGKTYSLNLNDLKESDTSSVEKIELADDHYYFKVVQSSGNWLEIPWDDVLYHCEPEYRYYKGKQDQESEETRAIRIGKRVQGLRTARHLSISGLAEIAGMKRPNLSRVEHGKHLPSLETIERLADALGVPVVELIVSDNPSKDGPV